MSSERLPQVMDPDAPVFSISVAASLAEMHPQTLRTYDRLGLVSPGRTGGGGRRYSWRDIELLREIADLTAAGIGTEVEVETNGPDEQQAMDALLALINDKFGEGE